ncbi:D-glycero-beta-D-manno-heptose-7-phosphate kinase [Sphingomonas profundi]|uniref:D-glycero-beta-D-manno-heptose-7-phosphate kinase n=1 Tax=Alterirhizorhabdus profundi TaxID=2681549 RepID=UPI001E6335B4|nr:D-glycero-beta-D-manno-heptose-7-phosphate kinase [Sphingomonas profundi]
MTSATLFDPAANILVVGDVMLDGYASGAVERISPEAPVPILKHMAHLEVPGGGANVATNLAALGGRPHLIGVIGDDAEGRRLDALLLGARVSTRLIVAAERQTTFKQRILAGNHQMLRIDKEDATPLDPAIADAVIAAVDDAMPAMQAMILSDYAKGCLGDRVLAAIIARARRGGVPVFVDPKRADFAFYAGADFITPNRAELRAATGIVCDTDDACRRAARAAIAATGATIVLTRSEQGMSLYPVAGEEIVLPTEAREVFDVSGAGDSVIASFALAIASGHAVPQALRLANLAAGLVIAKAGTATISEAELIEALAREHQAPDTDGAVGWDEAARRRAEWKRQKLRVGFTNGCFDLLHPGHIALLREAARQCDRLIVALNSDASVRRLKGPARPIQGEAARAEVMAAIGHVDLVTLFDQDTPHALIDLLKPDLLVKGSDYAEDAIVGADIVKAHGGAVLRVDLRAGHSTTRLVARSLASPDAVG